MLFILTSIINKPLSCQSAEWLKASNYSNKIYSCNTHMNIYFCWKFKLSNVNKKWKVDSIVVLTEKTHQKCMTRVTCISLHSLTLLILNKLYRNCINIDDRKLVSTVTFYQWPIAYLLFKLVNVKIIFFWILISFYVFNIM